MTGAAWIAFTHIDFTIEGLGNMDLASTRIYIRLPADYVPNRKIEFVGIDGDPREMKGIRQLTPLDKGNHTIVCYSVYLDPAFFSPQWLVIWGLKADLPDVLDSLQTKVLNNEPDP